MFCRQLLEFHVRYLNFAFSFTYSNDSVRYHSVLVTVDDQLSVCLAVPLMEDTHLILCTVVCRCNESAINVVLGRQINLLLLLCACHQRKHDSVFPVTVPFRCRLERLAFPASRTMSYLRFSLVQHLCLFGIILVLLCI